MPVGVPISEEKVRMIRKLKGKGLTHKQIAIQTRSTTKTVDNIIYKYGKYKEEDNG